MPYVWSLIVAGSGIDWHLRSIALFSPLHLPDGPGVHSWKMLLQNPGHWLESCISVVSTLLPIAVLHCHLFSHP